MKRLGLVLTLSIALAAPAQAADTPIADGAENVNAHAGITIWSHEVSELDHRLMVRRADGTVGELPVASSRLAYDPDLGPGPNGETTAVYSRCWSGGCNIYAYDFEANRERRVKPLSRFQCDEARPSIWRTRIVAERSGDNCRTRGIYALDTRTGKLKLLRKTGSTSVDGTDIRRTDVVWVGSGFFIGLLDATGRKRERSLYRDPPGEGEGTVVGSAAFGSEGLIHHVWAYYLEGDATRYAILRRAPRDCERANRSYTTPADTDARGIDSVAVDGEDLYYVQAGTLYRATDPPLRYSACSRDQR
jgi:hypothetical protein